MVLEKNFYDEEYKWNRIEAFERDAYICRVCDRDCEMQGRHGRYGNMLEYHHVDRSLPQKLINQTTNLVSVCWKCHFELSEMESCGEWGWDAFYKLEMKVKYNERDHNY